MPIWLFYVGSGRRLHAGCLVTNATEPKFRHVGCRLAQDLDCAPDGLFQRAPGTPTLDGANHATPGRNGNVLAIGNLDGSVHNDQVG